MKKPKGKPRKRVKIDARLHTRLKRIAKNRGETLGAVIDDAVRTILRQGPFCISLP